VRRSTPAADLHPGRPASPVSDAEFAAAVERLGPFEAEPHLAIAVSGGADSLALTLLADRWARSRGGRITGLTVDHGLRRESAAEARRVGDWLAARGIAHEILVWTGPRPGGDIQAAAREARYALLQAWCRAHGVLHLLVAHHAEDQAETLLLRLARGSGLAGLAAMAPIVERPDFRLLRPLLDQPRDRLRAVLAAFGQDWIEDPSNENDAFGRIRFRRAAAVLEGLGLDRARLTLAAANLGRARAAVEAATELLLARAAVLHPEGVATAEPEPMFEAPAEIRLRGLARLLTTIGGAEHPPRLEGLARLADQLVAGQAAARVLHGCAIVLRRGRWLIWREERAVAPAVSLTTGAVARWDGRFTAILEDEPPRGEAIRLGALGKSGAAELRGIVTGPPPPHLPRSCWPSLPALWQGGTLVGFPAMGWWRDGWRKTVDVRFRPNQPLCGGGFRTGFSEGHGR
jgi:tRNA(Ile)-lysidine synthase